MQSYKIVLIYKYQNDTIFRFFINFVNKNRKMSKIRLKNIAFCKQSLVDIEQLYIKSFPPEERRDWSDIKRLISQDVSPYNIEVIEQNETFVGFISWWNLEQFCYIEHFAIEERLRGAGIGTLAIKTFVEKINNGVVFEVELPNLNEMAKRRIDLYRRNGFVAHEMFGYIQPSYGEGLPSVPMMLMSANNVSDIDLPFIAKTIHRFVYGVKND